MAFGDVVSLKYQIARYLIGDTPPLDPPTREIFEFAYEQVESSEEFARRVFGSSSRRLVIEMNCVGGRLREALESHVSKQIDSQSESRGEGINNLRRNIHFFTGMMKRLEEDCADELCKSLPQGEEEEDDDDVVSDGDKSKVVGLSDQYNHLKERLIANRLSKRVRFSDHRDLLLVVSLFGMPGIGKTTLAREIFEDPDIVEQFDRRVWVRVGRKCRSKDVPRRILAEVNPQPKMCVEKQEDVALCLNESLKGKKYLIVLDDVWDKYMVQYLETTVYSRERNKVEAYFPSEGKGSRLLLSSRLQQEPARDLLWPSEHIEMRLMDREESWHLLREKVFAGESCPSQLEKFGWKIAERCEGLPLTIVTVANLLSKAEKTTQYWNEVATQKNHQLIKAAYDETSKVLLPSYNHLPRLLQMCFMYIGVFRQNYVIPRSKLFKLWNADGFLQLYEEYTPSNAERESLEELSCNSMVMICKKTLCVDVESFLCSRVVKSFKLHSSMWHLSNREATGSKFSYVLNSRDDGFREDIKSQHRLSFHNNILFGIKDVNESVEDNCGSTARSLLCFGPYLQYQVPICFGLRLLKELDALAIRFYEFPVEVLQLVELRYLALTLNGKLPAAISQLSKVRFLLVDRHLSIKSCKESSYLPVEIWNMKELKHLQVTGSDLPSPCVERVYLSTLSGVSPNSCTEDIFRAIPMLKKLGIQVELSPDNGGKPLSCLGHVSHLSQLKWLKCVVVNPKAFPSFAPLPTFPMRLRKLTLSGLGYAWEEMSRIASLQHLRLLKLRNYAFRGPEWEVREDEFPSLESLVIEDTDLVKWKIGGGSSLRRLIIKRCYKLKEIDGELKELEEIEMVDCNPSGAERMQEVTSVEVRVICSWYDEKPKASWYD